MTEPMKRGALARVVNACTDLASPPGLGVREYTSGFEFEVEYYVPDGEIDGEPAVFYWGNAFGGIGNVCVLATDVEQVKSAEEMAARQLPTPDVIIGNLDLLGSFDDFRTDEMNPGENGTAEVFGKTEDGLTFGFRIRVVGVWETDA